MNVIFAGVSDAHREAGAMVRPSVEISQAGGKYTFKTLSELKNTELTFTPGQELDETTADNRQCKVMYFHSPKLEKNHLKSNHINLIFPYFFHKKYRPLSTLRVPTSLFNSRGWMVRNPRLWENSLLTVWLLPSQLKERLPFVNTSV